MGADIAASLSVTPGVSLGISTDSADSTLALLTNAYKGDTGAQGYGIVASVPRDNFAESDWTAYGTIGHVGNWSGTESTRNGCRIGDLFIVVGTATDSGNAHTLVYRSDTDSGTLHGECIAHTYAKSASESAAKADAAAKDAYSAASEASTQAGLANDAAELANDAASSANASASKADTATKSAIDAASKADAAAKSAGDAASLVADAKAKADASASSADKATSDAISAAASANAAAGAASTAAGKADTAASDAAAAASTASASATKADTAASSANAAASTANTSAAKADSAASDATSAASAANASASKADTATKSAIDAASSATASASKADTAAANVKDGKRGNRIYYSSYADSANQEGAYFSDFTPAASAADPPMAGDLVVQPAGYILEITSVIIDNDEKKHGGFVGMGPYLGNIKGVKGDKGDFTPTTAQLAAMNSGLDAKYAKPYIVWLSDKFPNRTQGQFTICRSGNICIAAAFDICVSTTIAKQTVISGVVPEGFRPITYSSGNNGLVVRTDGGIRTGSVALTASSWWRDTVVYITKDSFPDDTYIWKY